MSRICFSFCLMFIALFGSANAVFAENLPACPSSGYFHNCFGTHTFASGDKYVGEFRDDAFHGQGTYAFASGDKYVGEFRDGKPNGQGTYTYANGRRDVGEFKDGVLNGYAVQYRPDGSIIK